MDKAEALAIIDKLEVAQLRDVICCLLQADHPSDVLIYSRGRSFEWANQHRWQPELWDRWREWAARSHDV